VYTPLEGAIVRYARASTRMEPIDDELYGRLKEHLSDAALVELCLIVGTANLVNRFHATFHTDVDAWTDGAIGAACPLPLPPRPHDDLSSGH